MKALALIALTIAAVILPGGAGLRVNSAAAAPAAQARACQNIQLHIQYQSSQGAAGHILVVYRIHNLSGRTCTLDGYPGVQLLDQRFLSMPTTVHRGLRFGTNSIVQQRVRVAAGANAYFTLGYSDVPVNNGPCRTARYLMIIAPNDFLPVVTYAFGQGGITACSGLIDVSPVTAQPRY